MATKLGLEGYYRRFLRHLRTFAVEPGEDGRTAADLPAAVARHLAAPPALDLTRFLDATSGVDLRYFALGDWYGAPATPWVPPGRGNTLVEALGADPLALRALLTRSVVVGVTGAGDAYLAHVETAPAAVTRVVLWDHDADEITRVIAAGVASLAFAAQLGQLVQEAEHDGVRVDLLEAQDDVDTEEADRTLLTPPDPDPDGGLAGLTLDELHVWTAGFQVARGYPFERLAAVGAVTEELDVDSPACDLDRRALWIARGLAGAEPEAVRAAFAAGDEYRETLDEAMAEARFATDPALGLYWLLHTYLTGEDDAAERVLAVTSASTTPVIADGAALVRTLRQGVAVGGERLAMLRGVVG